MNENTGHFVSVYMWTERKTTCGKVIERERESKQEVGREGGREGWRERRQLQTCVVLSGGA